MLTKCPLLCGYEGEFSTFKDGLCPNCKGIPKENISKKEREKTKSSPLRIIVIIILGSIALGVLLMATGTPPGIAGFFIFLPVTVILPIMGVYFLISWLFKSK